MSLPGSPLRELEQPGAGPARAWAAAGAWMLGLWVARALWERDVVAPAWAWACAAALLAAAALPLRGRWCATALVLAMLAGGAAWMTARTLEVPRDALLHHLDPSQPKPMTVEGVVADSPRAWRGPSGALAAFSRLAQPGWSFDLLVRARLDDPRSPRVNGRVRVLVPGSDRPPVQPGDRVRITAIWSPPDPPLNPGMPEWRLRSASAGSCGTAVVSDATLIVATGRARGIDGLRGAWARAVGALRARASSALPDESAGPLARALLLGAREHDDEVSEAFARQGVAHVLAISGFHLAVLAGAALFAVRLFGDRGAFEPLAVAAFVGLYVLIVPAEAPVVRAAWMVAALLVGEACGRQHHRLGLLAWVAVLLLLREPMDLWSLGYQLSVGLTAVLLWLARRTSDRLFPSAAAADRYERPDVLSPAWWADGMRGLVSSSVLCWAVSLPWLGYTVGVVAPAAALTTVLITPLVTLMLWIGALVLAVGVLAPGVGAAASAPLAWLGGMIAGAVRWLDDLPGTSLAVPRLSSLLTIAWTAWLLALFARNPRTDATPHPPGTPQRGTPTMPLGLLRCTLLVLACWTGAELLAPRLAGPDLRLDAFAVGDGTCHVLRSGGDTVVWDCGSLRAGIGRAELPRAMAAVGVRRADTIVLSHANFDHYSAVLDVAPRLGVRRVIVHPTFLDAATRSPDGPAAFLLAQLDRIRVRVDTIERGDQLRIGRCTATILNPPPAGAPLPAAARAEVNDQSLVASVRTPRGWRLVLTGDIQAPAISALPARGAELRADVLELPHHGSFNEASAALLRQLAPAVVVQSTGPARAADPRWNVERRVHAARGGMWFVTSRNGWSWVELGRSPRAGSLHPLESR